MNQSFLVSSGFDMSSLLIISVAKSESRNGITGIAVHRLLYGLVLQCSSAVLDRCKTATSMQGASLIPNGRVVRHKF